MTIEITSIRQVTSQGAVLEIASLRVPSGEITALVGTAGSGVETVFDLLAGKIKPSQGQARLDGIDSWNDHTAFAQSTGVLFAEDGLYKNQTVLENLLFECRLRGLPKERLFEALALLQLSDQQQAPVHSLSPSQKRRLAFARAILHRPANLLLWEPFLHCDEASIQWIGSAIKQAATAGAAVLVFASEGSRLASLSDSVYELQAGRLVEVEKWPAADSAGRPFKIPVKLADRVALINPSEILYAEASGDNALIQTLSERLPTQYTLSELEERLKRSGFFRAHRAYLVNLQHVCEVIPFTRNSFSLRLDDAAGTILPLSKSAASELKELLDF
jgi:ABC-2 type transport system ATP-binding protein